MFIECLEYHNKSMEANVNWNCAIDSLHQVLKVSTYYQHVTNPRSSINNLKSYNHVPVHIFWEYFIFQKASNLKKLTFCFDIT